MFKGTRTSWGNSTSKVKGSRSIITKSSRITTSR